MREGRARGESKGWRLVEVRGGTGLRLASYRAEGRSWCGRGGGGKHGRRPSMVVELSGEAVSGGEARRRLGAPVRIEGGSVGRRMGSGAGMGKGARKAVVLCSRWRKWSSGRLGFRVLVSSRIERGGGGGELRGVLTGDGVDGWLSYQSSFGLASGQVLCVSQGTLLPSSVNPRYRIYGTMCNARSNLISGKHFDLEKWFCI
jgi:hypothetical protein